MLLLGGGGMAAMLALWFVAGGSPASDDLEADAPRRIETDGIVNRDLSQKEFVAIYGNRLDAQARHGFVGKWFRATLIGIFLLLAALTLGLSPPAAGPLPWLQQSLVRLTGWVILMVSFFWVVAAQAQMGASWRIGIDAGTQSPLVTGGVFAVSRNPIFLGMRASLLGLFLVMPNAFTLAIFLVGEVLISVQVRLEEDFLSSVHGVEYERYRRAAASRCRISPARSRTRMTIFLSEP